MTRILPALFLLFFAITLIKIYALNESHDIRKLFIRLFTMTYIFDETVSLSLGHTVWWSIATEFQFYLIMPILFAAPLAWANGQFKRVMIIAIGIPITGYIITMCSSHFLGTKVWIGRSLLYHAIPFSAGIALASLTTITPQKLKLSVQSIAVLLSLALMSVLLIIAYFDEINSLGYKLGIIAIVLSASVTIFIGRLFDTKSTALANMPMLRSIGALSFLIYLLHVPIMQALRWFGGTSLLGSKEGVYAFMVIGSVIISWIIGLFIHRCVEVPIMKITSKVAAIPAGIFITYAYVAILLITTFFALAIY